MATLLEGAGYLLFFTVNLKVKKIFLFVYFILDTIHKYCKDTEPLYHFFHLCHQFDHRKGEREKIPLLLNRVGKRSGTMVTTLF